MEFDLSVEQQLFVESVRRLATDRLAEGAMATDELTSRFLPQLLAGEEVIAFGMTEPDVGSAVTDLRTSATKRERSTC